MKKAVQKRKKTMFARVRQLKRFVEWGKRIFVIAGIVRMAISYTERRKKTDAAK